MKRVLSLICILILAATLFVGCKKPVDPELLGRQLGGPQVGDTIVIFETSMGTFKAVLFAEEAPLAVANFIELAQSEYYNDLIFHRVISEFVIQSGDPTGTGSGGESASGSAFKNEYSDGLHHYAGALGMANSGTDTNMSQFYVVQGAPVSENLLKQMETLEWDSSVIENYRRLGGTPTLDNRYTVFGQVYEGMDVVIAIGGVKTDSSDRPKQDVQLISVTIETYAG